MTAPQPKGKLLLGLSRQASRYLLVAGTTALIYLGLVAAGLALDIQYFLAIVFAQLITIVGAFPFYRRFIFESTSPVMLDFVRFITVWSSGMIAGLIVTPILVETLSWDPLFAQVVAIAVVSVLSFLGHRYFSFRKPHEANPEEETQP